MESSVMGQHRTIRATDGWIKRLDVIVQIETQIFKSAFPNVTALKKLFNGMCTALFMILSIFI